MNIWIVAPGEPAVFHPDMAQAKPMRAALLSSELTRRGHHVLHWTGQFQHHDKAMLSPLSPGQERQSGQPFLQLVPSPGYRRNISFARLRDHRIFSRNWAKLAADLAGTRAPDIILCSYPMVDLAAVVCAFGQGIGTPVLLDLRDQWPDVIYRRLAGKLHVPKIPPLLFRLNRLKLRALRGATGFTTITHPFLEWGLREADRATGPFDAVFHLAPPPQKAALGPSAIGGKRPSDGPVTLSWVGTLVDQVASRRLLDAVASLPGPIAQKLHLEVRGRGQLESHVKRLANRHAHINWKPFADARDLSDLWARTDWAVVPYDKSPDFLASIPNKVGEALCHGVHILSPTGGETERLLSAYGVYHRVGGDPVPDWKTHLMAIAQQGPQSPGARRRAMTVHARHFDGSVIYPAFADHVEMVAAAGFAEDRAA